MEIEAKFSLPDDATLEEMAALKRLGRFRLDAVQETMVHDTYLDTADRALLAAGWTCRHRAGNAGILLTVKQRIPSRDAVHRREEYESALPDDRPPADWEPGPARELVLKIAGDQTLVPLCELDQTRRTRVIRRGPTPIGEMSLDAVEVASKTRPLKYRELEIELRAAGTEPELRAIVRAIRARWRLRPEPRSKFERALAFASRPGNFRGALNPEERAACSALASLQNSVGRRARALLALNAGETAAEAGLKAGLSARRVRFWCRAFHRRRIAVFPAAGRESREPARPAPKLSRKPGLARGDSMSEAARKTLLFHFRRMISHEAGTQAGQDIEELHDMRVATRRMRAALYVFADYLDAETLRPFAKGLRRTGRALGAVRDLDVFRVRTEEYLTAAAPAGENALEPLLAAWRIEYEARRAALMAHLDSEDYARFKESFGAFLDAPGAGAWPMMSPDGGPVAYRVRHVLPGILFAGYAEVRVYEEWLSEAHAPLGRYHQLRIASKRLRYTLEFFQEVLGPPAKPLIEITKRLQDHLGTLQDAVVACSVLRDFLMWGRWRRKSSEASRRQMIVAPGVATYLAARQAEIQDLIKAFPAVWSGIASSEFNSQLAALAAEF